jgi:N-acetylneuraminic acid mutarotase
MMQNMKNKYGAVGFFLTLLVCISVSCSDDEKTPLFSGGINFGFEHVTAATAEINLQIQASGSPVKVKDAFVVYGTAPGLTEQSGTKAPLPVSGGVVKLHGLNANTTYYAKAFIFDENNVPHHTEETSVQTEKPQVISTPPYGVRGSKVKIAGDFLSYEKSENKVFFGNLEAEVISVKESISVNDSLEVVVPEALTDAPVKISVVVGGATATSTEEFFAHSIVISSFSPTSVFQLDTIIVQGESLREDGKLFMGEQELITTFHTDPEGNYYTAVVPFNDVTTSGNFDIVLKSGVIQVKAPVKLILKKNQWSKKADFGGGLRESAISFTIGNKAYAGLGINEIGLMKDLWEYNPDNNTWTKKADFPGEGREDAVAFSVGTKAYVVSGRAADFSPLGDVWQYDPATDSWTQKNNFPGVARAAATGFAIGDRGYIGVGRGSDGLLSDWWQYNPADDTWTRKTDFPGSARQDAAGFTVDSKGYVGLGNVNGLSVRNDLWEYNPDENSWTEKSNMPGAGISDASALAIGDNGYVVNGFDTNIEAFRNTWQYNAKTDSWVSMQLWLGTERWGATAFVVSGSGYVVTGGGNGRFKDMWRFDP